ncbi:MAG: septum formation initiator family protein [Actinobacteria bacterium]|nr:septum formation initiator family protein [Actinomycetota bacterium]
MSSPLRKDRTASSRTPSSRTASSRTPSGTGRPVPGSRAGTARAGTAGRTGARTGTAAAAGVRTTAARAAATRISAARTGMAARTGTARARPAVRRTGSRPVVAPRTPFAILVLALLGVGLVLMLMLNGALAADSFRQRELQQQLTGLSLQEQDLRRQVDGLQAPAALAEAARRLGMVPSGDPAFIVFAPDGSRQVIGSPAPATGAQGGQNSGAGGHR